MKKKIILIGILAGMFLQPSFVQGNIADDVSAVSAVSGDLDSDGDFDVVDIVMMTGYLFGTEKTLDKGQCDFSGDGIVNIADLCCMKEKLILATTANSIYVTDTAELKEALSQAKPGDDIVLAPGKYVYEGSTPKGRLFVGEADGTEDKPITLRSENPNDPAVLSGIEVSKNYVLTILGDHWIVRDIVAENAGKGIIVDNSCYTKIINCEVRNIGQEGIHLRDDSSYCIVESCYVHDTGLTHPSYGEAVYVGSSKSTTDYGFNCDYNTIRNCRLGPNVTAEHVDVKEYTTGTIIEGCTFDGTGMSGENYADSFVDMKGNDCILRNNTGYRNGCTNVNRAFEMNRLVEGWGQNAYIYNNKAYMDTPINSQGKKMYFLNSWNCTETVWNNYIAYEDGELISVDNPDDKWDYYNCNGITYGDSSIEEKLGR
ncbi:MAG: hypothetical protein E7510_02680 [Ruminococcus sp.]|nr:hypothetical protein [Ruminococcus sp.]